MQHLRFLLESRPILSLVPDQSMLLSEAGDVRKEQSYRAILRSEDGKCALVYSTRGLPFDVDLSKLSGTKTNAWWYSPRDGSLYDAELEQVRSPFVTLSAKGAHTFTPPTSGENQDWVLVLDDAAARFPAPGTRIQSR